MTDNVTINPGTGVNATSVVAADDISGVLYQRNKLTLGADGANDGDVSKANPLPTYTPASTITSISGTITSGGVAQTLSASNTDGRFISLQNLSVGSLWLNDKGTASAAQPSFEIKAGGYYESPYATTDAISIFGATTGQAFAAREWK